tara:strand:+ start:291 stop:461 length:171 start_codon:yes stop_codon:yes gene_type:complete
VSAQFISAGFTDIDLVPSGGGVFEISVNGELRFSKKALGRFPSDGEVAALTQKPPT